MHFKSPNDMKAVETMEIKALSVSKSTYDHLFINKIASILQLPYLFTYKPTLAINQEPKLARHDSG